MYQHLFYNYHLIYILAPVWDTSTSISNPSGFLYTVLDPLKQSALDFTNPKQTFVRMQLLEVDCGSSHFSGSICAKFLELSSHTNVVRKQQSCWCTMVYLKDSFTVSSFLFLSVHSITLLQGLGAITTGIGSRNP